MPDCNETLREMQAFLDGELPPALKAEVDAHLGGCYDCLGAFEFHFLLRRTVATVCREEMPAELWNKVVACFGAELDPVDPFTDPGDPPPPGDAGPRARG
jgi:mycothiol system anti-sigma-R factor